MVERKTNYPVPRRVLYTVITGNYETLNELQVSDTSVHAICFTDDPNLVSSTWEIIQFEPFLRGDSVRSQRLIKILGHPILEQYDEWLYIDNSVRLLKKPSLILDEFLSDADLTIPTHSFRESIHAEFAEVKKRNLEHSSLLKKQFQHYQKEFPTSLEAKPVWTGIIARRPNQNLRKWADAWAGEILRFSRRDQLSIFFAFEKTQTSFKRIEIDAFISQYHEWPIHNNRKKRNLLVRLKSSSIRELRQSIYEYKHKIRSRINNV